MAITEYHLALTSTHEVEIAIEFGGGAQFSHGEIVIHNPVTGTYRKCSHRYSDLCACGLCESTRQGNVQNYTAIRRAAQDNQLIVLKTPDAISFASMAALKGAVKLEIIGLKRRGESASAIAKRRYGLKGNKQSVYDQLCQMTEDAINTRRNSQLIG